MKVGDTIYRFDSNRRRYTKPNSGPDFEYHFDPVKITGETPLSWLVGGSRSPTKVNKKRLADAGQRGYGGAQYYTEDGKKAAIWMNENRPRLWRAIQASTDYETLLEIDALLSKGV